MGGRYAVQGADGDAIEIAERVDYSIPRYGPAKLHARTTTFISLIDLFHKKCHISEHSSSSFQLIAITQQSSEVGREYAMFLRSNAYISEAVLLC